MTNAQIRLEEGMNLRAYFCDLMSIFLEGVFWEKVIKTKF